MADAGPASLSSLDQTIPRWARPVVILSLLIAGAVYLVVPLLAYNWVNRAAFLGVTLEQTFNVNDSRGEAWGPSPDRLDVQIHIQSINGIAIDSPRALDQALSDASAAGDKPVQIVYLRRTTRGVPESGTIS